MLACFDFEHPKPEIYIDPKAGRSIFGIFSMLLHGQKPYGEWMKHLKPGDTPPRGKCKRYFEKHRVSHLAYHYTLSNNALIAE